MSHVLVYDLLLTKHFRLAVLHPFDRFQRGTTVDCVQEVAAVRPDEEKLVCLGAVAPEHRYLVVRDLESAVAELRLESTTDRGAAA